MQRSVERYLPVFFFFLDSADLSRAAVFAGAVSGLVPAELASAELAGVVDGVLTAGVVAPLNFLRATSAYGDTGNFSIT